MEAQLGLRAGWAAEHSRNAAQGFVKMIMRVQLRCYDTVLRLLPLCRQVHSRGGRGGSWAWGRTRCAGGFALYTRRADAAVRLTSYGSDPHLQV